MLGTATYVNVECLILSHTRACIRGDYAVIVLHMSLSRGIISSCTVYWSLDNHSRGSDVYLQMMAGLCVVGEPLRMSDMALWAMHHVVSHGNTLKR